jgi:hypothetical protein
MEDYMADGRCPSCGKPLPTDLPLGLCPECLLKSGFETGDAAEATARAGFAPPRVEDLRALFPQLELLELVGRGGMGAVYKARQPALDRLVALKILPPAISGEPGFADRFSREARALARLQHPRIVTVYDFGLAGTLHFLLMEYVDGPNLREVQRSARRAPAQALRIVSEICEALQFAHDRGVVHRDIKPENVLLDREGHVKITDFGIAKMFGPNVRTAMVTSGDVVGTPHYMAPEQIERPGDVDHRADIYSLGVVFYELLTGELPLGKFAAPSSRVQVDVRLDEVVLRTLEKEPARRYQQASHVKTQVEGIAAGSPVEPPALGPARPSRRTPIRLLPAVALYVPQAVFLVFAERTLYGPFGLLGGVPLLPGPFDPFLAVRWLLLHMVALFVAYVAWGMLHYSCWLALPERYRLISPGRAVGFLFIPLFNAYWVFPSLLKLADGFQAWSEDHPEQPIKPAAGLGVAKAASFLAYWTIAWIPGFALIVCAVDAVLFALYYRAVVFNANLVIGKHRAGRPAS